MRRILITFLFILIGMKQAAFAFVSEYFDDFYSVYLKMKGIDETETLSVLYEISKNKINAIEDLLVSTGNDNCVLISLIDEEYKNLVENLEFETASFSSNSIKRRNLKKLKAAHKKFMHCLKEKYQIL